MNIGSGSSSSFLPRGPESSKRGFMMLVTTPITVKSLQQTPNDEEDKLKDKLKESATTRLAHFEIYPL